MWTIYKKLNVSPNSFPLVIPIKQYSSDFVLKFKLYSTDGDLDIEAGATTKIRGTKRDGNGFELTGTRIGSTCTFSGTKAQMQQMTAAHGRCVFEIVVENNTRELITANFYLEVQRAAMDAGTVTSESIIEEFADFQSKITAAQAAATAAQAQADRAEAAAESIDFGLDATPTQGSTNAVSSGGVYDALAETQSDIDTVKKAVSASSIYEKIDADSIAHIGYVSWGANATLTVLESGNYRYTDPIDVLKGQTIKFTGRHGNTSVSFLACYRNNALWSTPYTGLIKATGAEQTIEYTAPYDMRLVLCYSAYYEHSGIEIYTDVKTHKKDSFESVTGTIFTGDLAKVFELVPVDSAMDYVVVASNLTDTDNSITIREMTAENTGVSQAVTYPLLQNEVKTIHLTTASSTAFLRLGNIDTQETNVKVFICPQSNYFADANIISTLQDSIASLSTAITNESSARNTAITDEENARISADTLIQSSIQSLDARVEALENQGEDEYVLLSTDSTTKTTKTVPANAVKAEIVSTGTASITLNQLFNPPNTTNNGLTYTSASDGWITISGTSSSNSGIRFSEVLPLNHVGLCKIETDGIELKTSLSAGFEVFASKGPGYSDGNVAQVYTETFLRQTNEHTWGVSFRCGSGNTISGKLRIQLFDLTVMFGEGNEPTTVEDALAIIQSDFIPYNTGTVLNIGLENILLNGAVKTESEFAVNAGNVITIKTTSADDGILIPIQSTINYYKSVDGGGDDEGGGDEPEETPAYVEESESVTTDLLNESADLRIMFFTDAHSYDDFKYKKFADMMGHGVVDYLVGLGDYKDYVMTRSKIEYKKLLLDALTLAGREANCIYCIGNHDVGIKGVNGAPNSVDYLMTPKEDFDVFNRHYCKNPSIAYDKNNSFGGYYYLDNEYAKVRMIVLNTSDIFKADGTFIRYKGELMFISQRQLTWFTETACKLNKSDASEWSIIVFCHWAFPYGADNYTLFEILKAVKTGTAISKTFTVYNRMTLNGDTWTTTVDTEHGDTLTIDSDYTSQGSVNVLGIVYGHNHSDDTKVYEGINSLMVRCDNGQLDNYYLAPVNGITAGTYYFTDENGVMWAITFTRDYSDCAYIGYNRYFSDARMSPMPISRYDSNKNRQNSNSGCAIVTEIPSGATEVTGFVSERGDSVIGKESAEILCIDKENRTLTFIPYGTASKRVVSY